MPDKYRMTDADMRTLAAFAPDIAWKRSQDGGASARVGSMTLWVTRQNPYSEPRGGWMVQVHDGHYEEVIRKYAVTLPGALRQVLRQVDMESARWATLAAAMACKPNPTVMEASHV
jgi:hypothetical protein